MTRPNMAIRDRPLSGSLVVQENVLLIWFALSTINRRLGLAYHARTNVKHERIVRLKVTEVALTLRDQIDGSL